MIVLTCTGTRENGAVLVSEQIFTWHMKDGWSKLFARVDPGMSGLTEFRAAATYSYHNGTNGTVLSLKANTYFDNINYVF